MNILNKLNMNKNLLQNKVQYTFKVTNLKQEDLRKYLLK